MICPVCNKQISFYDRFEIVSGNKVHVDCLEGEEEVKVIGERKGGCGTLPCDNCDGKTGYLYVVEKGGKTSEICTSCKSIINLTAQGKGSIITRIWEHKTGEKFKSKI